MLGVVLGVLDLSEGWLKQPLYSFASGLEGVALAAVSAPLLDSK